MLLKIIDWFVQNYISWKWLDLELNTASLSSCRSEEGSEHLSHAETSSHSGASGDLQLWWHALHGVWVVSPSFWANVHLFYYSINYFFTQTPKFNQKILNVEFIALGNITSTSLTHSCTQEIQMQCRFFVLFIVTHVSPTHPSGLVCESSSVL